MLKIISPLLLLGALIPAQTASTITINTTAVATAAGAGYNLAISGTGTLTGFGTGQLFAYGSIPTLSGLVTTTPLTISGTMVFTTGDALSGQFVVAAGYLIPQLGQSVFANPTFTITGGTGAFAGASGYFPNLSITASGANAAGTSIQGTGNGTVLLPASHTTGTLSYSGSFAHFASGVGWDTIITLVNEGTTSAQAQLNFFDESGNPSTLPLDFPQGAASISASSVSQSIKPGTVLVIDSQGGTTLSVGSAQLLSDGKVSGFLIFRYLPTVQEAAVDLETQSSSTYTMPFDDTGGISTGIALSVASSSAATIQILVQDDKGNTLATDTISLPGHGHTSFVLGTRYTAAGNVRGSIQFQGSAGSEIGVIGIRALASGAYTTIPAIGN
jgi:hypothetical protein